MSKIDNIDYSQVLADVRNKIKHLQDFETNILTLMKDGVFVVDDKNQSGETVEQNNLFDIPLKELSIYDAAYRLVKESSQKRLKVNSIADSILDSGKIINSKEPKRSIVATLYGAAKQKLDSELYIESGFVKIKK